MIVLCAAYVWLTKRHGVLLLAIADVLWMAYAVATGQIPLFIVSLWCGAFSVWAWVRWP